VRRWLVALLALIAAAGAIYLLLSSREPVGEGEPDHAQIDSESRAKLRQVLREERGE
jgi:hypothetical protein